MDKWPCGRALVLVLWKSFGRACVALNGLVEEFVEEWKWKSLCKSFSVALNGLVEELQSCCWKLLLGKAIVVMTITGSEVQQVLYGLNKDKLSTEDTSMVHDFIT